MCNVTIGTQSTWSKKKAGGACTACIGRLYTCRHASLRSAYELCVQGYLFSEGAFATDFGLLQCICRIWDASAVSCVSRVKLTVSHLQAQKNPLASEW